MEKIIEIPEGYEARIEGNKVVLEPKPSEDERMRKLLIKWCQEHEKEEWFEYEVATYGDVLAWLEKKKEQKAEGWKPQPESLEALLDAIEGNWDAIKPTGYMSRRLEDLYEGLVNTFNIDENHLNSLLPTEYTKKDIEEVKALKEKIDSSMDTRTAEWSKEDYVRVYEPRPCTMISTAVRDAIEEAKKGNECLILQFNGVCLPIEKNSNPNTLEAMYYRRWKPTKEQMRVLRDVITMKRGNEYETIALRLLYDDLKELK